MAKRTSCLLILAGLLLCCVSEVPAQSPSKSGSASISGQVKIGDKGVADMTVVATSATTYDNRSVSQAKTDADGNYRLNNLPAGSLRIFPVSKGYAITGTTSRFQMGQSINLAEGEAVTNVDFKLLRGGVITGRILDSDGNPLVGEQVNVTRREMRDASVWIHEGSRNRTDDRGIYRIYGLAAGEYTVSVGQEVPQTINSMMYRFGSQFPKTYYPGTDKESEAKTLEVKDGSEVTNIDFTVGKPLTGFTATGRVVDGTGQPQSNVTVGYAHLPGDRKSLGMMNVASTPTDANGRFRVEGLQPGNYAAFTLGGAHSRTLYSPLTRFEVVDTDVSGIEIKLRTGATIRGVAVIENNSDPAIFATLQTVQLFAAHGGRELSAPSYGMSTIKPDGTFSFEGLAPGRISIGVQQHPQPPKGFSLSRLEVNGIAQDSVEVTDGAEITGVRLVFLHGSGSIRGRIKVEGGTLPEGATVFISLLQPVVTVNSYRPFIEVDARGQFFAENIPPGTYELKTYATIERRSLPGVPQATRTVTITSGVETDVTIVLDLTAAPKK